MTAAPSREGLLLRFGNAKVYVNGRFVPGGIDFDGVIRAVGGGVRGGTDLHGAYVIPGLVDVHSHGAAGADVSDGDAAALPALSRWYARHGVTSWCPTTMSLPEAELLRSLETLGAFSPAGGAKIALIHMEGPFLATEKRGAHRIDALRPPELPLFHRLREASRGLVGRITLAPELPGAVGFIEAVRGECAVSLGHTAADYDAAMAAFRAGASSVTHLFNAMPPMLHRAPSLIAAAADSGAFAELIADGLHVHPAAVRLAFRLFGGRVVLISDSLRCAGMPEGDFDLGGQRVSLRGGAAWLAGTDTLAGSAIDLMEAVRRCVSFGIPLETAVYAATAAPARLIGRPELGELAPGRCADLVILDGDLNIVDTYINGAAV